MMQLLNIKAVPHPLGNRVDIQYFNPEPDLYQGVRIMRREYTHPISPEDGVWVADKGNNKIFALHSYAPGIKIDLDSRILPGELSADFPAYHIVLSAAAVVSVIEPGSRWQISDEERAYIIIEKSGNLVVYGSISVQDHGLQEGVVYYYSLFPFQGEPREYISRPGNRVSAMATGPYDFAGQLYRILPTIYHRYDKVLPVGDINGIPEEDKQKGQLRRFLDLPGKQLDQLYSYAAAALNLQNPDRVDGKLLPLLAQWIGWTIDHNLEISGQRNEIRNAPAFYKTIGIIPAVEAVIIKCIGSWHCRTKEFLHNVFLTNSPERLNLWLCERTSGQWQEDEVFSLDFAYEGRPAAAEDENKTLWLFYHTRRNGRWEIWYKTSPQPEDQEERQWTPSRPLFTGKANIINKYPSAALQVLKELDNSGQTIITNIFRVFWSTYDETARTWNINYRERTNGEWCETKNLEEILPAAGSQRKNPCAVVDDNNALWLFWLEKVGMRWQLKYNRNSNNKWESSSSIDFPLDGGDNPRVEEDLFVLIYNKNAGPRILTLWSRKKDSASWEIALREKTGIDSLENGWGPAASLPKIAGQENYHDKEPAAAADEAGNIELYWSTNRPGNWTICSIALADITTINLDAAEVLSNEPYSRRSPLPLPIDNNITLIYRSNKSIFYQSEVYRTETYDLRYSGSLAIDARSRAKNALRGRYEDFQTYTYDTGRDGKPTKNDWYSRDTFGIYIVPDTDDQQLITKNQEVVKSILARFLPIQTRVIFIIEPPMFPEKVYTYDLPAGEARRLKGEQFFNNQLTEVYSRISRKKGGKNG